MGAARVIGYQSTPRFLDTLTLAGL